MKTLRILPLALLVCWMSCNPNPGWDGHDSDDPTDRLAEAACKCIYVNMDAFSEFEVEEVLEEVKAYKKDGGDFSKYPQLSRALAMEADISEKIDESDCFKPLDEDMLSKGITFDDMMDAIDEHCLLGMFYN